MDLYKLSAVEISKKLRSKEVSAREVTKSFLNRINLYDKNINAFITVTGESALETADIIDEKIKKGEKISPLAGIPIAIKDNILTKGIKTTAASKMLLDYIPPYNATVMDKINEQNGVVIGKANMDEFAMGSATDTSYFFNTKNPLDFTRVAGGSSGGSIAAVASGEVAIALGSDTGGSIRLPASFTGTVGLKPTYGRISRRGVMSFGSSLDCVSPCARNVSDVALLFENIIGKDEKDPTSINSEKEDYLSLTNNPNINGMKIGIPKEFFSDGVDKIIRDTVLKEVEKFRENGAIVEEISIPTLVYTDKIYYIISSAQATSNFGRYDGINYGHRAENFSNVDEMIKRSRGEGFGEEVKTRLLLGTYFLKRENFQKYYGNAVLLQNKLKNEFAEAFSKYDLLIAPTSATTAYKFSEKPTDSRKVYAADICTTPANLTGVPAMSIPCGKDENNLPIGMQLFANHKREDIIFNAAAFYEKNYNNFNVLNEIKEG